MEFPFDKVSHSKFEDRPRAMPSISRTMYRMGTIVLVLKLNCRAQTSSYLKLQFFNAILHDSTMRSHEFLSKSFENYTLKRILKLDPFLDRALKFALADELVSTLRNGKFKLTSKGDLLVEQIVQTENSLFVTDTGYLRDIGKTITEKKLGELLQ